MEAVAAIGFGIAVVQARSILSSIKTRIENYRKGPGTFQALKDNVDSLDRQIVRTEELLGKFPNALPADISGLFFEELTSVGDNLRDSFSTMERSLNTAFAGSSSAMGNISSKRRRTIQATALATEMDNVKLKINWASNKLQHLITILTVALKADQLQDKMDSVLAKTRENQETAQDIFCPRANAPAITAEVQLDFDDQDADGRPATPEGILKRSVFTSNASSTVTAATGVIKPAYGIVGMAGVGKTVALQGLAHDKDIRLRFPDGVFYMTLGQGATVQTVLRELVKILTITGSTKIAATVGSCSVLRDAVDHATHWFKGRICLFLVDDVWPTNNCKTGFLTDFRQLLRESPDSRMAISTRSTAIAQCAGIPVNFGARDPLGSASMKIFMAHATRGASDGACANLGSKARSSILKILTICAGLPIALAVTGSAVAFLSGAQGDFDTVCESYATRLEKKRGMLGDADTLEGASLNAGILLSLEYLEVEFLKRETKRSGVTNYSISDLYTSFCVFENQSWVSASVLGRLWRLDKDAATEVMNLFCGMSLATLHWRHASSASAKEAGVVLHDLQLDFCVRQAMETKASSRWHAKLLQGYLETTNHPAEELDVQLLTSFMPRNWWSSTVPEDGYIHANLCRHLSRSGNCIELAALLLDSRWTEMRWKIGGIFALEGDFKILDDALCSRGQQPPPGNERRGFDLIFKAVQLSWRRLTNGLRVFQFHVCGRLTSVRKSNAIVDAFVKSVYKYTPKPFLFPVSSFFPELDSALIMEIPVGGSCESAACSPCGRYFAAGAGSHIVVAICSTGEILQHLSGHTGYVHCIAFANGSKQLFSGSSDKTVIVWEWESLGSPMQVFEGHDDIVSGVAVTGDGGQIISSSWDRTLRVWDAATGTEECVLPQSNDITCFAFCEEGRKIALVLGGGALKILDSVTKDVLFEDTEAHRSFVSSVSFSPTGLYLATGSQDRAVQVWNTQTWTRAHGSLKGRENWVKCLAFSADGKHIASSSHDRTIRLWDVESGSCVGISPKISSIIENVSFTGDGKRIVSGSTDGIARIWDARLGKAAQEHINRHSDRVWGVAISQNGLQVASASQDGTVRLWDTRTGEQIGAPMEGHTERVLSVSFSPDGRRVVSGSDDGTLRLWDTETQTQIGDPFEGHARWVSYVSFSFDGLRIVSGSDDRTVRIWSAETHKQIGEALEEHLRTVSCVSESSDGFHIVSRDCDGQTIIWNRESRAILWKSEDIFFENEITYDEAERIIRSCGVQTPHLWPKSFPDYASELCCADGEVHSNLLGRKIVLADLDVLDWKYNTGRKLFAAGLESGAVAICNLITE